jgi:amino acid adenylation domain-containing protein
MEETPMVSAPLTFAEAEIEGSIQARFARVVAACGDRPAIKEGATEWTYSQLDRAAEGIMRAILRQAGPRPEPIALLLGDGFTAIPAILGVLRAGKFYVALDPTAPQARQAQILRDSGARYILTERSYSGPAAEVAAGEFQVLVLDDLDPGSGDSGAAAALDPGAPMGLFYTSGSTGRPKGIEISHRYALRYAWTVNHCGHLAAEDRQGLVFSYGFAAGLGVVFSTLLNGATLCPFDLRGHNATQIAAWLLREEISFLYPSVSLFRELVNVLGPGANLPSLRRIFLAGQTVYRRDVARYQETFHPNCMLLLGFSSTEAGAITEFPILHATPLPSQVVPVGSPLPGVEVGLYDTAGQRVGPLASGEIGVRSRYMATSYWRDSARTREKFLADPEGGDKRLFMTGDLGRLNQDGTLELMGRKDFQVKIRGYRIELAEVEAALFDLPCILQAVVVDQEAPGGEAILVAYVIPAAGASPSQEELRLQVSQKLPAYMIPSVFAFVDHFPLTSTGKILRSALPAPPGLHGTSLEGMPSDGLEHQLIPVWEEVLGVRPIGIDDDFLNLGGDSIKALRLSHNLQTRFGKTLPMVAVLQLLTIRRMAKYLQEGRENLDCLSPALGALGRISISSITRKGESMEGTVDGCLDEGVPGPGISGAGTGQNVAS